MNQQDAVPVEKTQHDTIALEEIFYTLQGEGPFSGCPAVFVRLSGCNLRCSFCDTNYSSYQSKYVEEVVRAAVKVKGAAKLCVVTGGEPFRQYQMPNLVRELLLHFDTVQIETSGSCFQSEFSTIKKIHKDRIQVICSPKTPKLHKELIPLIDAYKYVVRFGFVDVDGLPNEEPQRFKKINVAKPHAPNIPVFISPWDEQDLESNVLNVQQAVDSCLTHGYRLSLQVHKIVNLQ